MRRDLTSSIIAILAFTLILGIGYPLLVTGISQLTMEHKADGSQIRHHGKLVGSELVAQKSPKGKAYFQPRPSQTDYTANASSFRNLGPNQQELADFFRDERTAYLKREQPYDGSLRGSDIPVDAVTNSASGIDPHISVANARIQAHRVAKERSASLGAVLKIVDRNTSGRAFGLFGEPAVNVLHMNLDLDQELPS